MWKHEDSCLDNPNFILVIRILNKLHKMPLLVGIQARRASARKSDTRPASYDPGECSVARVAAKRLASVILPKIPGRAV